MELLNRMNSRNNNIMMKTSKRKTIAAALIYGAAFCSAFVIVPKTKIFHTTTKPTSTGDVIGHRFLNNKNNNERINVLPPLYFWNKNDDSISISTDKKTTLENEKSSSSAIAFPWFFPGEDEAVATIKSSSSSSSSTLLDNEKISTNSPGNLDLIVANTQEVLGPAARALDDATDGWALGYADLQPETEATPVGQAFLATNVAYALAGLLLSWNGEVVLGWLTECAAVASFCYHYTQLQAPTNRGGVDDSTVRLALMVDYVFAVSSILLAALYLVWDHQLPPMDATISGGLGLGCLFACWVWEEGLTYIVLHSLWHLFSAYCGFAVGTAHIGA